MDEREPQSVEDVRVSIGLNYSPRRNSGKTVETLMADLDAFEAAVRASVSTPNDDDGPRFSDGRPMCAACCWGDRCDNPEHYYRPSCPVCKGTGERTAAVRADAAPVEDTDAARELQDAEEALVAYIFDRAGRETMELNPPIRRLVNAARAAGRADAALLRPEFAAAVARWIVRLGESSAAKGTGEFSIDVGSPVHQLALKALGRPASELAAAIAYSPRDVGAVGEESADA